ncbi:MAG: U32 family peptidase [Oscillospiraceae bacterium]|nr:U32 family peptidase [Oscillospiraceae bacterium]MBQ6493067.1 U32 family peptidase [Erysipelotrichaceae bacterium]
MELLLTLRKKDYLEKVIGMCDGVIIGSRFVSGYHLTLDDLETINIRCKAEGCKVYIVMDNFISEDERMSMYEYLEFINELEPDGIYFHDLGVFEAAGSCGLRSKLIYDGKTVLTNSLDSSFFLDQGIDSVVIARELTLDEIKQIVRRNDGKVDMQIFGHMRMSYSRRRFLTNYFKEIGKEYDYLGRETLTLIEEKREYRMPIVEDEAGTMIYSDYILEMFSELPELRPYLKRGIIDTLFIEDVNKIVSICREYRRVTKENSEFLKKSFIRNYPDSYSSGYLYQRTNISKDE